MNPSLSHFLAGKLLLGWVSYKMQPNSPKKIQANWPYIHIQVNVDLALLIPAEQVFIKKMEYNNFSFPHEYVKPQLAVCHHWLYH